MKYSLRTLMIVVLLGPPLLALAIVFVEMVIRENFARDRPVFLPSSSTLTQQHFGEDDAGDIGIPPFFCQYSLQVMWCEDELVVDHGGVADYVKVSDESEPSVVRPSRQKRQTPLSTSSARSPKLPKE